MKPLDHTLVPGTACHQKITVRSSPMSGVMKEVEMEVEMEVMKTAKRVKIVLSQLELLWSK